MLLHLSRASFGTRTNVFLPDKAEIAVETRQDCAVFFENQKRTADYPASASSATAAERCSSASYCRVYADWSRCRRALPG